MYWPVPSGTSSAVNQPPSPVRRAVAGWSTLVAEPGASSSLPWKSSGRIVIRSLREIPGGRDVLAACEHLVPAGTSTPRVSVWSHPPRMKELNVTARQ